MGYHPNAVTVLLDGDDTLWKFQQHYEDAKQAWVGVLSELGPVEKDSIAELDRLDAQRVAIRGLNHDRFCESLLIYTAQLTGKIGIAWTNDLELRIREIAAIAQRPPVLFDDTLEALEALSKNACLILVTAGDTESQHKKIFHLGLEPWFKAIHIVPRKDPDVFERIVKEHGLEPGRTWMVGNSPKSDIEPAIQAGLKAILVIGGTWVYDQPTQTGFDERFAQVQSLGEATQHILKELAEEEYGGTLVGSRVVQ